MGKTNILKIDRQLCLTDECAGGCVFAQLLNIHRILIETGELCFKFKEWWEI